ncbi:hypothetical protein N8683_00840 [bacterium]|nr:hypothetical protein [bacterium]MDB4689652.1 hypothetical protein [Verrucomicrobiota bacterium]MDB4717939.1 hypothetical protein [Verrucomicrobiota bacterium]MDB4744488.1 hypothetical protein [Verrucomicrobiota bacterium]
MMFKIEIQLEPKRKSLYEEAIRRLRCIDVCNDADTVPDARIVGPENAISNLGVPCLVDQPEKIDIHMLASLMKSDSHIMPAHALRFSSRVKPIDEALRDGKLGKPGLMRLHHWATEGASLRQAMFGPMDLARWFFQDEPSMRQCVETKHSLLCHLQFPSDGMALMNVSNPFEGEVAYESVQLIGSAGAAYGDDHHNTHLHFRKNSVSARIQHNNIMHGLMELVSEFVDGILNAREWNVSLKDTLRIHELLEELVDG